MSPQCAEDRFEQVEPIEICHGLNIYNNPAFKITYAAKTNIQVRGLGGVKPGTNEPCSFAALNEECRVDYTLFAYLKGSGDRVVVLSQYITWRYKDAANEGCPAINLRAQPHNFD